MSARAQLIDAASRLFARDSDPSVRAIASEAGVNHGLVHHYFGSKDGLRKAVLDALAKSLNPDLAGSPGALAWRAVNAAADDPRFVRILARSLLDGDVPEQFQSAHPMVRTLIRGRRDQGDPTPAETVAEGLALGLGWLLFGPWIRQATGISKKRGRAMLEGRLRELYR